MVSPDMELELRRQLKEAGRLLSSPPASIDELLHILDQLERLLSMVDQTPNSIMKEALSPPTKALVHGSLLEHSSMDVKVSVASCLCELTRITAPDAPYSDEEMKGVFKCIVSSFENLSDKSSRYYAKRVAILDNVAKVRAPVIMLDIECYDLLMKLFEHFLNSVRDDHPDNVFSLMAKIMALVLEESEDISIDMLKILLASVKNNVGILPVARKLGEEVFKRSAYKLRPYISQAVTILGDSLVDYSPVLTSICEGTTDFVEHKDESASVQPNVVDTTPATVSLNDKAQVISNAEMVTENAGDIGEDTQLTKSDGAVDHPTSGLTSKLDTNDSVAENSGNVGSKLDTTESAKPVVSETVHGENITEKSPEMEVSVQNPLESEVSNAPSQSGNQQEESQSKIQITKGIRSKKKGPSRSGPPSTVTVLTKVNEETSDQDMKSPKRIRKKTPKAEENNPSVTTGSDVELLKNSGPKPAKKPGKKVGGDGSVAKKPKVSGKKASESKTSKQDEKKVVEAGDSEVKPAKQTLKKDNETDSDAKPLKQSGKKRQSKVITKLSEDVSKKNEETASAATPLKPSGKKRPRQKSKVITKLSEDVSKKNEETDSAATPLKPSGKKRPRQKSKVITKPSEDVANKNEETDSDATPLKPSGKKRQRSKVIAKPSADVINKDEETDSDATPLKQSCKKGQQHKVITKPSEDVAKEDEETESDNTPLKLSFNKLKETKSDPKPLNLSENKDDEETDSDNIPLKLSAKRVNKSSSVVKSSSKNKNGKKQGLGKNVEQKDQTKSLSENDDGMDVSIKSGLKKATKGKGKENSEGAHLTGSKKKQSVTKKKETPTIKYNASLVGQKVKVWWPEDKIFYEGVVESFDTAEKKHKVLYLDNEVETLNLRKEKWEFIEEYSTPITEVAVAAAAAAAVEAQHTDILPEIAGSSKAERKVKTKEVKSKEDKEKKKDDKKQTPKKIVYSRSGKGTKRKAKSADDNVKESKGVDAAEEPENEKEKSTESPKIWLESGEKKMKMT